jgi:dethiobiotin synthetase
MAKRIFITATNTDIGKTYTTKLLLTEFASRGFRVGVIKPIETGVISNIYLDGNELLTTIKTLNEEMSEISMQDIVPISYALPSTPYIASNMKKLDLKKLDKAIKKLENLCDILLIEGAGGLYVPLDEDYMIIDLIKYFNANALLVTHCSLGCINDTLLSEEALKNKNIKYITAFNCRDNNKSFSKISQPYFANTRDKILKVDENIDTICDVLYNL